MGLIRGTRTRLSAEVRRRHLLLAGPCVQCCAPSYEDHDNLRAMVAFACFGDW